MDVVLKYEAANENCEVCTLCINGCDLLWSQIKQNPPEDVPSRCSTKTSSCVYIYMLTGNCLFTCKEVLGTTGETG